MIRHHSLAGQGWTGATVKHQTLRMSVLLVALLPLPGGGDTWSVLEHDGAGRPTPPYLSSLNRGEIAVGAVRSEVFVLDADMVSFQMCGWDGQPGQRQMRNWFALCDADTGLALRRTPPPNQDAMTPVSWDVVEYIGRRVYLRAVDGMAETGFSWIGWCDVRVGDRQLMATLTPGRLPEGWMEEAQPEGKTVEEWLACPLASSRFAYELSPGVPTWGVVTYNGIRQECAPYLSSLRGGESGVGAVRSPEFVLDTPRYEFLGMGADTPTGDAGLNLFQLVDAETQEILRQAEPPVGNTLLPVVWDTADLIGRRVFFRAVDNNDAPAWAWIGCDRVPLGAGRVAVFERPEAIQGWREEGQPEGAPVGAAAPVGATLAQMVETEWAREDLARGVRWTLWERNPSAAPYLMARLTRLMERDFARGRQLVADFTRAGAPEATLARYTATLTELERRMAELRARPQETAGWRTLRLQQRRLLRQLAFENPVLDFHELLFVKRYTQQSYADINVNHHAWGSRPGGDICVLRVRRWGEDEPQVRPLIAGRLGPGNVHGIDLDWEAKRVVFAYARSGSEQPPAGWLMRQATFDLHRTVDLLHLYELELNGLGLRQLTFGPWSDLNPCYLPNGDIAFESERCGFELECNEYDKDEPTTNLYAMHPDGTGIRRLQVNKDGDWYPRVLNDGNIIYSHWEYHERSLMFVHPLWIVRPDGTGADAFAKQHFNYPLTLTVPRPIPGSHKVVAIATGHHTLAAGPVVIVDRAAGPNDPTCLTRVTGPDVWPELGGAAPEPKVPGWHTPPGRGWYMDPYPLSETTFLASYCDGAMQDEAGYGLYLLDVYGGKELIYRDPTISSVMPIPVRPRPQPPVVHGIFDGSTDRATCIVTNVTAGVPELKPGEVKAIRISEPVPWPYDNEIGGQRYEPDAKATGVNWTPVRVIGTVPVEPDGSAHFRVPANTAVYFQALDENGMDVRRMRTYVSFQPGEIRSCTGCHETRAEAPPATSKRPLALRRPASVPKPPPWGSHRPISFLRDVQPVLDRHCASCHTGLRPAGGLDLSGGLTAEHNRAYDSLLAPGANLVAVSPKYDDSRVTPVRAFGSHQSRLVHVLRTTHMDRCHLEPEDWERLLTWIDANAVYHDDFIHKRGPKAEFYSLTEDLELWGRIEAIHQRRCAGCHGNEKLSRPEWVTLERPERSLFVAAPLAGAQTPSGRKCQPAVYADATDPDCATVMSALEAARARALSQPRRDLRCLAVQWLSGGPAGALMHGG